MPKVLVVMLFVFHRCLILFLSFKSVTDKLIGNMIDKKETPKKEASVFINSIEPEKVITVSTWSDFHAQRIVYGRIDYTALNR